MKNKGIICFLIFLSASSLLVVCTLPPLAPLDSHVKFRIAGVNFQEKNDSHWYGFSNGPINFFEFFLRDPIENPFYPDTFSLHEVMQIDKNNVTLPNLNTTDYYNYVVKKTNKVTEDESNTNIKILNLYDFYMTRFINKDGNKLTKVVEINSNEGPSFNSNNHKNVTLRTGTTNEITLNYSLEGYSAVNIDFDFKVESKDVIDNIGIKSFNYNANWEELIRGNPADVGKSLNIAIMADGFNENQMRDYQTRAGFLRDELFENNFFREHRDNINIFRIDTESHERSGGGNPTDPYYNIIGVDNNYTPLGNTARIIRVIKTSFAGGPLTISDPEENKNERVTNIDAFVILCGNYNISYTFAYGVEIAKRNGQPVNVIIMPRYQAPRASLAHMLGHALARLQDEENLACNSGETYPGQPVTTPASGYNIKYRNISSKNDGIKWKMFLEDYQNASEDKADYGIGTPAMPFKRILYTDKEEYYIPTKYSAMAGKIKPNSPPYINYNIPAQFGPVNFYHMEASYLIRTGVITAKNDPNIIKDQEYDSYGNSYEWNGYTYATFKNQYPPSYFADDY